MKKTVENIKRAVSILLAAAVLTAAMPQTGMYVCAAEEDIPARESSEAEAFPETGLQEESLQTEEGTGVEKSSQTEEASQIEEGTSAEKPSQTEEGTSAEKPSQTEEDTSAEKSSQTEEGSDTEQSPQTENIPDTAESSYEEASQTEETTEETETEDEECTETQLVSAEEDTALTADGEYLVYDDSLKNFTVTPGSYHASIWGEMNVNGYGPELCVLFTTKDASQNDFFPGQKSIVDTGGPDSMMHSQGYGCEVLNYTRHLDTSGKYNDKYYSSWTADFSGQDRLEKYYYVPRWLTPETTYRYRIATRRVNKGGMDYTYYFLSVPQEFTTKAPVETSAVSIKDVSVDELGYSCAKISWTVDNPGNEYIADTYITGSEYGDTKLSGAAKPCLDENECVIPGKFYTILETDKEQDYCLAAKVYIGTDGEQQTITAPENIHIVPRALSDNEVAVDVDPSTSLVHFTFNISPWYAVDAGYMHIEAAYRVKGSGAKWTKEREDIRESSEDIFIQDLPPNTTYEYYVTLRTGRYVTKWCMGSEEEPLTFTTTQRVVYEDSAFPDEVLRGYIKQQLEISASAKITSDKLDTLTYLLYSNNYPSANYPDQYKGTGVIKSLEGVQYMKNLTRISLFNHAITDASMLSGLKELEYIDLRTNDITKLPDLSGLSSLKSAKFEANKMKADSITSDKLSAAFLQDNPDWVSKMIQAQLSAAGTPTKEQLIQRYTEIPWSMEVANTYSEEPSIKQPYAAGRLSDATLTNAMEMLNFVRYTAGVRDDVSLNEIQTNAVQTGTLLNAVNQQLSHTPVCPEGFPRDLYDEGSAGCFNSNIAAGFRTMPYSILAWLRDCESYNVREVGHRRGTLDPTRRRTGLGATTNGTTYSGMYVGAYAKIQGREDGGTISDFVAWPARNTPTQFMSGSNYPWSIALGSDYYLTDKSAVTVTLKNKGTGRTWTFNSKNTNVNGDFFNIFEHAIDGVFGVIIFRPKPGDEVTYAAGTRYEISVTGLTDRTGSPKPLNYTVEFFTLPDSAFSEVTGISLNKTALNMQPGQSETLTATVKPANATNKNVTWSSSNAAVAAVDQEGTVTAAAPGDAVITVTAGNGKTAVCKVKVREYSLDKTELSFDLAEGVKTETLTVSDGVGTVMDAKWSSSDESVAAVSVNSEGSGVVTPTGSGKAFIWIQIKNGPRMSCAVTVKNDRLAAVSLSAEECSMETGSTRKLHVYIIPKDTTLSTDILWSSDNPAVASVEDGLIRAVSRGTAVITAAIGSCTAKCVVTVYETAAAPAEDSVPKNLSALTNVQTRLSDISLQEYEGWKWVYGEAPLTQFAGKQQKSFAAVYSRDGYADWQDSLTVALFTLTGMQITADSATLARGVAAAAQIRWSMTGPENSAAEKLMSEYEEGLDWSSSSPSVVKVTGEGAAARLEAVGTGKASVKAQITLGGKTFKAQYAVTVVDKEPAGIVIDSADGLEIVSADTDNIPAYRGNVANADAVLHATVTNASRLAAKSSNPDVVAVGKAVAVSDGKYSIPLTVKSAGTARLMLTSDDAAKTGKDIILYITDPKPNISGNTVTINTLKTGGTVFNIYPNEGYSVERVTLSGADAFQFTLAQEEGSAGSYRITANAGTAKGSYQVEVKAAVAGTDYALPLAVKVVQQRLKYTVKQSAKANLFYRNLGAPKLTVTSSEKVTDISLDDCDFKIETVDGSYQIMPKTEGALTASCDKKGILKITFDGYEPVCADFTVGVMTKAPRLSLDNKNVTLYPNAGLTTAKVKVLSGKQLFRLGSVQCSSRFKIVGDELILDGSDMDLSQASSFREEIKLTSDSWTGSITLPCTVRVNMGIPTLKLQKNSLQLNADASVWAYDMAATEVMWKDAAFFDMEKIPISVSAANPKSQELINVGIIFETASNGQLTARLNHKAAAVGTYKFKVHAKVSSDCTVSAPLTVKIVSTNLDKAVSLSAKGSIDVLNRDGSFVTVIPSLKALNGSIADDRISLSGRSAHLFRASREDGQFIVRAKEDVSLITKYNYGVNLNFTVENADGETIRITTPEIKLKLKQGRPKVSLIPKGAAFFDGAYNSAAVEIHAALKGAADPVVETAELANGTDAFIYENDRISLLKTGTSARKGKTYSLTFRITFKGHADNEKPTTAKYSAAVR